MNLHELNFRMVYRYNFKGGCTPFEINDFWTWKLRGNIVVTEMNALCLAALTFYDVW